MKNHWKVPLALLFALASFAAVLSGTNKVSANRYEIRAHEHYTNEAGQPDSRYVYGLKYVEVDDPKTIVAPEIEGFYPDQSAKPLIGLTSIVFEYFQKAKTSEPESPQTNPDEKEQPKKDGEDTEKEPSTSADQGKPENVASKTKVSAPSWPAKRRKVKSRRHRCHSGKLKIIRTRKKSQKRTKKSFRRRKKKRTGKPSQRRHHKQRPFHKTKKKGKSHQAKHRNHG